MSAGWVTKAEILIALSHALDRVEGQPEGHAARSCLIAMKIGVALGLSSSQLDSLYFAALLKDAGCSNNSARIHNLFGGDEFLVKHGVKFVDWANPLESLKYSLSSMERGRGIGAKLRRMAQNVSAPGKVMDEVTQARCTRGAMIAKKLGFTAETAAAIEALDEHWDGKGSPRHLAGDQIPILAQILGVSQTLEVFFTAYGLETALQMLGSRTGRWFSAEMVTAAKSFAKDKTFWQTVSAHSESNAQELPVAAATEVAAEADIDQICEAFAMIVDAKSFFTAEHSTRVTQYAVELGQSFGFAPLRLTVLRRAGLLHDIGKLGVSNAILEKPGKLDEAEFNAVKQHSRLSYEILKPVKVFQREAELASAHHERLDGKGYWRGLTATELDLDMRILSVADVYDALSAKRPYRDALPIGEVFAIMEKDAGNALDAECVGRLKELKLGSRLDGNEAEPAVVSGPNSLAA